MNAHYHYLGMRLISSGMTVEAIIDEYPHLTREDVLAAAGSD